jgi:hypothetical protein
MALGIWLAGFFDVDAGEPGFRRFAETVSPNGEYVLAWGWSGGDDVTKLKEWAEEKDNTDGEVQNYLVDAVKGRVLGVIPGCDYFRGTEGHQNHGGIAVGWSMDSKDALVITDTKWSSAAVVWIRTATHTFIPVQESLEKPYRRLLQTKEKRRDPGGMSFEDPAILPGGVLAIYCWAQIPKEEPVFLYRLRYKVKIDGGKAQCEIVSSRKLPGDDKEAADEESLNKVYGQLRGTLNEAERAALKAEEVAWLKQREAIDDEMYQGAFTRWRVSYLRARLGK